MLLRSLAVPQSETLFLYTASAPLLIDSVYLPSFERLGFTSTGCDRLLGQKGKQKHPPIAQEWKNKLYRVPGALCFF